MTSLFIHDGVFIKFFSSQEVSSNNCEKIQNYQKWERNEIVKISKIKPEQNSEKNYKNEPDLVSEWRTIGDCIPEL